MRILVLGGTGFIGTAICRRLGDIGTVDVVAASSSGESADDIDAIRLDATDGAAVRQAVSEADIVVNCITGSADAITASASNIAAAAKDRDRPLKVIHMSTMSVYGDDIGNVDETTTLASSGNWYAVAKREAERLLSKAAGGKTAVTMLRIGCAFGPGSPLWVDRIGLLIRQGRLGDIGELGDGWSNLVHVNDIAKIVGRIVQTDQPVADVYNFAAPDSPRWNDYFRDFALGTDRVPLEYKPRMSMLYESYCRAPLRKGIELLLRPLPVKLPYRPIIPPSLLRLWGQQIRLDSTLVQRDFDLTWTPYETALSDSIDYFRDKYGIRS